MNIEASFRKTAKERMRRGFLSATPERMAKTGEEFRMVPTEEHGATIETQKVTASPLERLYKAGAIKGCTGDSKTDEAIGNKRVEAGEIYYKLWFYGRSFPLGSRDYRKPYVGSSNDPYSVAPTQERVEHARMKFRNAEEKLGSDRIAAVTRSIVIDEKEPGPVGHVITGRNEQTARAIAIEFLVEGLDRLRAHWGLKV